MPSGSLDLDTAAVPTLGQELGESVTTDLRGSGRFGVAMWSRPEAMSVHCAVSLPST